MPSTTAPTPAARTAVTVKPVRQNDWSPAPFDGIDGKCIRISLDPARRELSATLNRSSYSSRPAEFTKHQLIGSPEYFDGHVERPTTRPEAVRSYQWFPYGWRTVEDVNALLHVLAPYAAKMLDSLQPLPGRPAALDWTPRSATLLHLLSTLTQFPSSYVTDGVAQQDQIDGAVHNALEKEGYYLTWSELHRAAPSVALGEWALADDAALDAAAEKIASALDPRRHLPEGSRPYKVTSVRAGLYGFRETAAAGLRVVQATDWYATHPGLGERVYPGWDETRVEELYAHEARAAANQGLRLVGFLPYVLKVRDRLRDQTRQELRRRAAAALRESTPQLRTAVAGLLLEVDSWGDPTDGVDDRDARLGELAAMSPQAVALLRSRIGGVEAWDGWMPVLVVRDAQPRTRPGRRWRWFGRTVR
ncbi:hypothetical protein ACFC26_17195 [Kitasatospora purpeofusca]|uniref:hypothetical protein n=1 Tax=Kitasatospora purpeofusca TaxID=67352 RepID=UPI0035E22814